MKGHIYIPYYYYPLLLSINTAKLVKLLNHLYRCKEPLMPTHDYLLTAASAILLGVVMYDLSL